MSQKYFYVSLQYSAIQKVIARVDRLWSMAGLSQLLQELNELTLPDIVNSCHGDVLIAGGGKLTARFGSQSAAKDALKLLIKEVATTLPMLEFQAAGPVEASSLKEAILEKKLLETLKTQKRNLRGHASAHLPHMAVCETCGELPAETELRQGGKRIKSCRICRRIKECAQLDLQQIYSTPSEQLTNLQRVYKKYFELTGINPQPVSLPVDFEMLFPSQEAEERNRLGIFFADINNMKDKVVAWLNQPEDQIRKLFECVTEFLAKRVSEALAETFPHAQDGYLPFRIIVAGGDDLCFVMTDKAVVPFLVNLSKIMESEIEKLDKDHPLSTEWLKNNMLDPSRLKPYCFGASFLITSLHTPFRRIFENGEELMKQCKKDTDRKGNAVTWRVMAEEGSFDSEPLHFAKPLFITHNAPDTPDGFAKRPTLADYVELCGPQKHGKLKNSQIHAMAGVLALSSQKIETWIKCLSSRVPRPALDKILNDSLLTPQGVIDPANLATLLELKGILPSKLQQTEE